MDRIYTSGELESMEIESFETITEQCQFKYRLTKGELGWLDWIGGRYTIADYLSESLEDGIVTIDVLGISEALHADGVDRAPCLSEDTQLQRLIWYIGPDMANEEE